MTESPILKWVFFNLWSLEIEPLTSPTQIFEIPNTYASVVASIQPIAEGEEVTTKYEKGGYYGEHCLCSSCTGKDTNNLSVLKPNHNVQEQLGSTISDVEQ